MEDRSNQEKMLMIAEMQLKVQDVAQGPGIEPTASATEEKEEEEDWYFGI